MGNIREKLTSRKLWAAVAAAALAAYMALRGEAMDPTALESLKTAVEALIAYICGESLVDASRNILARKTAESADEEG